MENNTENTVAKAKVSKAIVAMLVFAIFTFIGLIVSGVSYELPIDFITTALSMGLIVTLAWYLGKRAKKKGLGGKKLIKVAIYILVGVYVISTVGSVILIKYSNSLQEFANNSTKTFFANNLSDLKTNSTPDLQKVLSYNNDAEEISKEFEAVGAINECSPQQNDYTVVYFGPNLEFKSLKIGLDGEYSIRCFGENKAFDFYAYTKYKDGKWLVDYYLYNTDISKDFNIQNSKPYTSSE